MPVASSTFVRRQLGRKLQRLREELGKSQEDVAAAGIVSRVTLWRIETGQTSTKWPVASALCRLYEADEDTTANLVELAKASKGSGWFERYGDAIPENLKLYLGAELLASQIRSYDPEVVPGALQTPEYARALFIGESPASSPERIDELLAVRLERQQQYWEGRREGAILCVILGEAALAREVGGHATIKRQVEHLREVSGQDGTEVLILPWTAGAHTGIYGGFTIFQFPDPEDPTVVYTEGYTGGSYLDEDGDVHDMTKRWTRLHDLTTPIKEFDTHG